MKKINTQKSYLRNIIHLVGLLIIFSNNLFSQVTFEKGYFIDNENNKTACLIKNYDWKNSPSEIEFKLNESNKAKVADISDIKEFYVGNNKYVRSTVYIDKTSTSQSQLGKESEPVFEKSTLFLHIIIEGKANLYESAKYNRYFYNIDDQPVSQLIYKQYLAGSIIKKNNSYKKQIWDDLKCSDISINDIDNLHFTRKELIDIFKKYNICKGSDYTNYDALKSKTDFNLYLKPGLRLASLSLRNKANPSQNIDYETKMSVCLGIEAEFILPFNKNKWSVFIAPTYQYLKTEEPRPNYNNDVDYTSIELPIGMRYYMFLNANSKLYIAGTFVIYDHSFDSNIGYLDIRTATNLTLGAGYVYKEKLSADITYGFARELLSNYAYYKSSYKTITLSIAYNIF